LSSLLLALACAQGSTPRLAEIGPQTVAVGDTLRLPLVIDNPAGALGFGFRAPDLPGIERAVSIGGSAAGGLFVYSPLASHVGPQEFTILLLDGGGGEVDRARITVDVVAAGDAAPVFTRPGAGGTFDLERNPSVAFDIEVRDADTPEVDIGPRGELPAGASITPLGPQRAGFAWTPTPDQIDTSERWTVRLEADDREHAPTPHDFVVVLRAGMREDCPGEPPIVRLLAPAEGARVPNAPGYPVEVEVLDDMGLRDEPLLYYSTAAPDDPSAPDVTAMEQLALSEQDGRWVGRIPSLGLAEGASQRVFILASATDNDDPEGTSCDHRTDTPLTSFDALGGAASGALATCERCAASTECASGVCAAAAGGARCLAGCPGGATCSAGTCADRTTTEGSAARACGDAAAVCAAGGGDCRDDGFEDNDSRTSATPSPPGTTMAQICAGDDDYYRITTAAGTEVAVTVDGFAHADGDLDLQLLDSAGAVLDQSAGVTGTEMVSYCAAASGDVFARVFGYRSAENAYDLLISTTSGSCCADDGGEPDDSRTTARGLSGTRFDGTVCPGDDDWIRFVLTGPTQIDASIAFDHGTGDLDLELYGPTGMLVDSSRSIRSVETISVPVTDAGTYTLRVFGFRDAAGDYTGTVTLAAMAGCTSSNACPIDEVCGSGVCRDRTCTTTGTCPSGYGCPDAGPGSGASECGAPCTYNSGCRSSEACKRFPEGRYCGRRGSGANGAPCADFADCGGQRACLDWPGGYCARAGCASNADCETGTFCVNAGSLSVCAVDCWASDSICRSGYSCDVHTDLDGFIQFACVP
jgi:hypothetical protein